MILTTDALVGGTLALTLVAATVPMTLKASQGAADTRRDLIAETVATACNVALIGERVIDAAELPFRKGAKATGTCGAAGDEVSIKWTRGDTRVIRYDDIGGTYSVQD